LSRNTLIWVLTIVLGSVLLVSAPYLARRAGIVRSYRRQDIKGRAAPEFALESLDGQIVHLSDFRGKAVLVNFWATWCQPCKVEMPWFEELQQQYGAQGLQVIGIAKNDSSKQEIAGFATKLGVRYPILIGADSVDQAYGGIQFWPSTFFIGRDGIIVDHTYGVKSRSDIEKDIKLALSQGHIAQR
jgi:peroxiredoxin